MAFSALPYLQGKRGGVTVASCLRGIHNLSLDGIFRQVTCRKGRTASGGGVEGGEQRVLWGHHCAAIDGGFRGVAVTCRNAHCLWEVEVGQSDSISTCSLRIVCVAWNSDVV